MIKTICDFTILIIGIIAFIFMADLNLNERLNDE